MYSLLGGGYDVHGPNPRYHAGSGLDCGATPGRRAVALSGQRRACAETGGLGLACAAVRRRCGRGGVGRVAMMTRRLFCIRFLPALAAAPLAQWPERDPKTEQEKHNDKVDGEIFYLLYSDRIQNTRLEAVEGNCYGLGIMRQRSQERL